MAMLRVGRYILAGLAIGLGGVSTSAQTGVDTVKVVPGITIQTEVDRSEVYIGDLINYTVTIEYDSTYELVPPPLGANLGAFDVKDYHPDLMARLKDGRIQSKTVFVLSTFTTGDYVIPPIPVVFNLPDGSRKALLSEGVPIKVLSMLENAGDSVDIRPLKAQYEFKRDWVQYLKWIGPGFLLFVLAVALIWLKLIKRKEKEEPVDLRPAWEIAFEKLALLKQKVYLTEGKFKEFYIELTEILRSYLEKMYRVNVLDMTTQELLAAFEKLELPEGMFDRVKDFFMHADLVKFAKYMPEKEKAEADFDEVHAMVEEIRGDWDRRHRPDYTAGESALDADDHGRSERTGVTS